MASSHDLSCGERRSHQLSDTKTSPVPILQQDTYCPGHISHQDTCWHSLIQYCPTLYTCLTHIRTALLVTSWWRSWNMHFQKSAYFPGIKITRTQMLVRVFTKSFTWLINTHPTGGWSASKIVDRQQSHCHRSRLHYPTCWVVKNEALTYHASSTHNTPQQWATY